MPLLALSTTSYYLHFAAGKKWKTPAATISFKKGVIFQLPLCAENRQTRST